MSCGRNRRATKGRGAKAIVRRRILERGKSGCSGVGHVAIKTRALFSLWFKAAPQELQFICARKKSILASLFSGKVRLEIFTPHALETDMKQPTANKSHRFLAPLSMIPFLSILSIGATVGACGGGSASSVTPPGAPTISGTSSGNGSATISFSAPADDGGAGISTYTVSCSGNPGSVSGSASPLTVTGLTPG